MRLCLSVKRGEWYCSGCDKDSEFECEEWLRGRYRCSRCDFDLCKQCLDALPVPVPVAHVPLPDAATCLKGHVLELSGSRDEWCCDVCAKPAGERFR